ncbi:MAG TPA: carbohydrate kinase family protein [Bacteroidota bacterium]|nr:carbohydrate kinase family protein [Bacteroidota bacterium]
MTITVIGHLCLDEIHHGDGRITGSYGGIYFTVAALSGLLPPGDTVRPVFGVGREDHQQFLEALDALPNVDTSGIYKMLGPTNRVSLHYHAGPERIEVSRDISDPVPWKKIQPALDADLVLVNMISGYDITLETLDEIRMKTRDRNIPVFFDLHSLTLGVRENFERFRRPVEAWRRWLFMLHTVQMNEAEAAALAPGGYDEQNLVRQALALNTKALCITRGSGGCTVYVNEKKHTVRRDVPGVPAGGAVDPTGCGDVFGAAYCAHYVHCANVGAAAEYANTVAAAKAEITGSSGLDKLSRFQMGKADLKETTA